MERMLGSDIVCAKRMQWIYDEGEPAIKIIIIIASSISIAGKVKCINRVVNLHKHHCRVYICIMEMTSIEAVC